MDRIETFKEYSDAAIALSKYPAGEYWYAALGVAGEAGEYADKIKKAYRDNAGQLDDGARLAAAKELGDVLWYVNKGAKDLGFTLAEIAQLNLDKLHDRRDRGVLRGEGDNR